MCNPISSSTSDSYSYKFEPNPEAPRAIIQAQSAPTEHPETVLDPSVNLNRYITATNDRNGLGYTSSRYLTPSFSEPTQLVHTNLLADRSFTESKDLIAETYKKVIDTKLLADRSFTESKDLTAEIYKAAIAGLAEHKLSLAEAQGLPMCNPIFSSTNLSYHLEPTAPDSPRTIIQAQSAPTKHPGTGLGQSGNLKQYIKTINYRNEVEYTPCRHLKLSFPELTQLVHTKLLTDRSFTESKELIAKAYKAASDGLAEYKPTLWQRFIEVITFGFCSQKQMVKVARNLLEKYGEWIWRPEQDRSKQSEEKAAAEAKKLEVQRKATEEREKFITAHRASQPEETIAKETEALKNISLQLESISQAVNQRRDALKRYINKVVELLIENTRNPGSKKIMHESPKTRTELFDDFIADVKKSKLNLIRVQQSLTDFSARANTIPPSQFHPVQQELERVNRSLLELPTMVCNETLLILDEYERNVTVDSQWFAYAFVDLAERCVTNLSSEKQCAEYKWICDARAWISRADERGSKAPSKPQFLSY